MKIENVEISNFKSIKTLSLSGFKRVNLLIGRPNVGKSNIIEALSVFCLPTLANSISKKISNLIRLENERELFYDGNFVEPAFVKINGLGCAIMYKKTEGVMFSFGNAGVSYSLNTKLEIKKNKIRHYPSLYSLIQPIVAHVKRYTFASNVKFRKTLSNDLAIPFGENLTEMIETFPKLSQEIMSLFDEYGLETVYDIATQSIKVKQKGNGRIVFLLPYGSVADTLRRIIFYKTAIVSNENSVLLFEEPEAHAFPPYIVNITQEIIRAKTNQFFITTHSPFVVNDFLENPNEDVAIFIVDYKKNQTIVKKLSAKELSDVYQYGIDLFTNIEAFL